MHIPDGFLNLPTAAAAGVAATGGIGYALHRLRVLFGEKAAPLMGVTAGCVFAAQMINFPIAAGTSGHLMGGVLAAVLLGPWGGAVVIAAVLIVQCLLFGDGGVLALGANIVNMALIGSCLGYCIHAPIRRTIGGPAGVAIGAVVAAWFSVLLAAIACSFELAASGTFPLRPTFTAIFGVHLFIGLGEAIITGLAVAFVLRTRPDIIYSPSQVPASSFQQTLQVVLGGLAIAVVIAAFASPWASSYPDGLEWSAEQVVASEGKELPEDPGLLAAPIPDYQLPGIHAVAIATSLAGIVGTLITFGFAFSIGRSLRLASPSGTLPNVL